MEAKDLELLQVKASELAKKYEREYGGIQCVCRHRKLLVELVTCLRLRLVCRW